MQMHGKQSIDLSAFQLLIDPCSSFHLIQGQGFYKIDRLLGIFLMQYNCCAAKRDTQNHLQKIIQNSMRIFTCRDSVASVSLVLNGLMRSYKFTQDCAHIFPSK